MQFAIAVELDTKLVFELMKIIFIFRMQESARTI